jgi:hypothetical protein
MVWSQARAVASLWGKISFPYCWEPVWEGHFLILLRVGHFSHIVGSQVRVKVTFRMVLGIGGKSLFACWELVGIHFFYIIENWWKVTFLILLGVGKEFLPTVVAIKKRLHPTRKL